MVASLTCDQSNGGQAGKYHDLQSGRLPRGLVLDTANPSYFHTAQPVGFGTTTPAAGTDVDIEGVVRLGRHDTGAGGRSSCPAYGCGLDCHDSCGVVSIRLGLYHRE